MMNEKLIQRGIIESFRIDAEKNAENLVEVFEVSKERYEDDFILKAVVKAGLDMISGDETTVAMWHGFVIGFNAAMNAASKENSDE